MFKNSVDLRLSLKQEIHLLNSNKFYQLFTSSLLSTIKYVQLPSVNANRSPQPLILHF